ncbi:MAG: choice-of-anchor tandem repeat GloVer-containing protein, partial [Burkholderiales bacterium]
MTQISADLMLGYQYSVAYSVNAQDHNGTADISIAAVDSYDDTLNFGTTGAITIDTQAAVAITSAGGFTNHAAQTITGTGEVGTTVTILEGATTLGTATVAVDGSWTSDVTLSGLGPHSITASDTDVLGNVGTSAVDTITLAHPVAITSSGSLTNQPNQTITGTGEAGTTVTVFDGVTSLGSTTVAVNGTWSDPVTLTNAQGAHSISAVESGSGNTLSTSDPVTYTLDTLAPTVTQVTESSDNTTHTLAKAGDTITETFTASDTVTGVTIQGHSVTPVLNMDGSYTATYQVQAGDTGAATFAVAQQDAAGNSSTLNVGGAVTIDTLAPTVGQVSETSDNTTHTLAKAGDTITETFTASDTVTGVTIQGHSVTPVLNMDGSYTATYTVHAGDTGAATFAVAQHDAAGNASTLNVGGAVTIDTQAPTGAITTLGGFTNDPSPAVAGTGEAGATVTLMEDGATILGTTTVDINGDFVLLRNTFLLSQIGKNRQLTAIFTDDAGNVGTSNAISFTLADPVTITSSGSLTNQPHQTISGTGEAGTTVTVFDGATVLGSTTVLGNGTWSDSGTLSNAQGAHSILAVETGSGNTLSTSDPVTYTLDTQAPTVTQVTESSDNTTHTLAKAGDTITETFTATDTITGVTIAGHSVTPVLNLDGSYTATYMVQAGDTGAATFAVAQQDAAGNTSTLNVGGAVTMDTTAPTVTPGAESSNNTNSASLAKADDVITEAFTSTDPVTGVTIDGHAATVHHGAGNNYTATYTVQSGDTNGTADLSITALDAAGNSTTVTATGSVTVDTHAPTVAITSAGGFTNQSAQTIAGTGEAGTTVTILDGATTLGTTTVAGNGTWTSDVTLSGYGPHSVTAADADAAGNVGTSAADSITYAHPVTITSTGSLTNQPHQTISGTGEAGTTVTVFDGATVLGSTTVAGDGSWSESVTFSNAQGTHSISATESVAGGTPTLHTLVNFDPSTGVWPAAGLAADSHGNLYGTTDVGGPNGAGTLFQIDATTHALSTLISFDRGALGGYPSSQPFVDASGNVYGTAQNGDSTDNGTVWEYNATTHTASTLANLNWLTTGYQPYAGVVVDGAGNVYGTAVNGGTYGGGVLYEIPASTHTLTALVNFRGDGPGTGGAPYGSLTIGGDGNVYGTTQVGGNAWPAGQGTLFELNTTTNALTTLVNFSTVGGDGSNVPAGLITGHDGNVYGTTYMGGASSTGSAYSGYGTIFELDTTTHALTTLASFDSANNGGIYPDATLMQDANGNLFGTTTYGGANNDGTIFEYNAATHALTTLVSFNGTNGAVPTSNLVADASGNLYGTTQHGGSSVAYSSSGDGTLFELSGIVNNLSTSGAVTYTLDSVVPILGSAVETSNNANSTSLAKVGDTITETFTLDPSVAGVVVTIDGVTIDGQAAVVTSLGGDQYSASVTVGAGFANGTADLAVTSHDSAGNSGTDTITGTVTVDTVAPVVHLTSEVSNNATTTLAKAGDVITETFTSTDTVTGVLIDGNAATVHHGAGNNYTATYTVLSGDTNGAAGVQVTSHDAAGNVTTVTDGGSVVVDTVAPSVVIGSEASNNGNSAQATVGDVITEAFTSTDTVTGVTIGGHAATVHDLTG